MFAFSDEIHAENFDLIMTLKIGLIVFFSQTPAIQLLNIVQVLVLKIETWKLLLSVEKCHERRMNLNIFRKTLCVFLSQCLSVRLLAEEKF